MLKRPGVMVLKALVGASLVVATAAEAYTVGSPISAGCHELITARALRAVRLETADAAPLATSRDERALIDDLQFVPDDDLRDLGGASLLIGVRDNDLQGRSSGDVAQLTLVHGDPDTQQEHCLRGADQGEPDGTRTATSACRAYIVARFTAALAGLDPSGRPDPARRTSRPVFLSLRHRVDAPLPTFYLALGQALHAVEDSFTHAYRTPDQLGITATLDWIHFAAGTLDERTQGPPHDAQLDRCDDPDLLRARRRELATEAATAVLRLALAPGLDTSAKLAALGPVLDRYLGFVAGCDLSNRWCNAAEQDLPTPAPGCASGGAAGGLAWWPLLAFTRARRRRARHHWLRLLAAAAALAGLAAHAQAAPAHAPPPAAVAEPGPRDPSAMAWGGSVGLSGGFDNPSAALAVGLRLRLARNWTVGLDAEWNPWLSFNGRAFTPGALSLYASAIVRIPLASEQFNLRTTLSVGTSVLLMDLFGAPAGSVGLYLGLTPLGLEWKASRRFYLVVEPLGFALPAPHLTGVPLGYPQFRTTVSIELLDD